jgi:hypothetical protein
MLISVWGAAPGIGKSTLCTGLSRWLAGAGLRVDHFREEEIMTRPQFAAVADHFRETGAVEPVTLLAATGRFVDSVLARDVDVAVADALVPFIPSLLAMGYRAPAISEFMAALTDVLAPLRPVMIFLDGDAGAALPRAAAREEPGWLDWYVSKLAHYKVIPPVHDAGSAAQYLRRERAVTLTLAKHHDWDLIIVEHATGLTADEVLQATIRALQTRLEPRQALRLFRPPSVRLAIICGGVASWG